MKFKLLKYNCLLIVVLLFFSCKTEIENEFPLGTYRGTLLVQDNKELPFLFELESKHHLKMFNAEEVIDVDEIEYINDSVIIKMPVFEGYIKAKIGRGQLNGTFTKESLDRIVPFKAELDKTERFYPKQNAEHNVSGIWETVFSKDIEGDEYIAKGIFTQNGNKITGTFRTTTGDYRYLEGVMDGDIMKLSTFDGSHAFLFTAKVTDSTMEGQFYSGNHWKEPFVAKRNDNYELPDADSLTFLKEGYSKLEFSFPDANGNFISLEDNRFKDKVVVVQIMGSWCPNCLDESRYYTKFYDENKSRGVEFVALAFEYARTKESAFKGIKRLKDRIGINYPILLAQYGTDDKTLAQEKLPVLNHVLSYPTTIFVDKKGEVRKIHTGFDGPATGEKYIELKQNFSAFIDKLLSE